MCLHIMAAFVLTETICLTKPIIFAIWPFTKNDCQPLVQIFVTLEREQVFAVYHAYIQILGLLCTRSYLQQVL